MFNVCCFYPRTITQPLQNSNYCISVFLILIYILCVCGFLAQFLFDPNSMRQSTLILITSNTLVLPQMSEIIAIVKSPNLHSFGDDNSILFVFVPWAIFVLVIHWELYSYWFLFVVHAGEGMYSWNISYKKNSEKRKLW